MVLFLELLGVVFGLALATTLTGRALVGICGVSWLQRTTPESLIASATLGTGIWILGFGWASYLGLPARPAAILVLAGTGVLLGLVASRGRLGWLWPPLRPGLLFAVLLPCVLSPVLYLLPVLRFNGFPWANDATLYLWAGDWL
jgi:hypothetical protein